MNKIIYIFLIAFGAILASCEPETIEGSTAQAFSGELDATCELEIINGKAANMAILNCKSPVTCQWTDGISKLASNSGKIQLMGTGNQKITLTAMDQTGEIVTKEFTVNVQELAYPVPEIYGLLFDGSEKVWKWADGSCFGNGGFYDGAAGPQWWTMGADGVEGQFAGEGNSATMTFTMSGKQIKLSNGKTGTLDFSAGDAVFGNWYGTLTSSCGVLGGYALNETYIAKGSQIEKYQIISLTDDKMVLSWSEDANMSSWSTGWFWVFKSE